MAESNTGSVVTMTVAGEQEQRVRKRKGRNPYRSILRDMVAHHSMDVGRGFMKPDEPVIKSVELADGSQWQLTLKRTKGATKRVKPFEWPYVPRVKRNRK